MVRSINEKYTDILYGLRVKHFRSSEKILRENIRATEGRIMKPYKIVFVFGTRPEIIKMAPLIKEFKSNGNARYFQPILVHSGQHKQLSEGILPIFGIREDEVIVNLHSMEKARKKQFSYIESHLEDVFSILQPDMVVIQGDTTTAFAARIAANMHRIPVAYVEAGLRTHMTEYPFPEESNRKGAAALAPDFTLYFAPSEISKKNLLDEGIPEQRIFITGNTVIDALNVVKEQKTDLSRLNLPEDKKIILFTCHRREVWEHGKGLKAIFGAIKTLAAKYKDQIHIVYPVHLNPIIKKLAYKELGDTPNVQLIEPMKYTDMVHLMGKSYLIITDSGGIQEEAPALGKPVIIIRDFTERPEVISAHVAKLVSISRPEDLESTVEKLLTNDEEYREMSQPVFPYGKGDASAKILAAIKRYFRIEEEELEPSRLKIKLDRGRQASLIKIQRKFNAFADQHPDSRKNLPQKSHQKHVLDSLRAKLFSIFGVSHVKPKILGAVDISIDAAKTWLMESGVQNKEGAVSGYFDYEKKEYTFAYPEITGYSISTLLDLSKGASKKEDQNIYFEKAKRAADWLIDELKDAGAGKAIPARQYYKKEGFESPEYQQLYYTFDNGIVLSAFVEMYQATKDMKYMEAAKVVVRFLLDTVNVGSNDPYACFNPKTNEPVNYHMGWSTFAGAYLAKTSEGLIKYYEETGDERCMKAALSLCDRALKYQEENGRFVTSPFGKDTNAHPHCYAAEGLLFTASYLKKKGIEHLRSYLYTQGATKATKWLIENMSPRGEIWYAYENNEFQKIERSDVLAQVLYLGSKLIDNLVSVIDLKNQATPEDYKTIYLYAIAQNLMSYQTDVNFDAALFCPPGGFGFGTDFTGQDKKKDINAWCTLFAMKALQAYKDLWEKGRKSNDN